MTAVMLYVLFAVPLNVASVTAFFQLRRGGWWLEQAVTACFFADMCVNLATGVYVREVRMGSERAGGCARSQASLLRT